VRSWFALPLAVALIAVPTASAEPDFETYCTPVDPALAELSGLTFGDGVLYAIGDSGNDEQIAELDEDCAVTRWIPNPVDPYDVEDLAFHNGSLWLADIGDNGARRPTIALTRVDPADGSGELYRLRYPDGAHNAEAVVISPDGEVVIVTKDLSGHSRVYELANGARIGDLVSPGPSPLEFVGDLRIPADSNSGGEAPLITGAAVRKDGTVVAVRSYWDAYLYPVGDGGLADALTNGDPASVRIPPQPQGEAIAFGDDGSLLVASEAGMRTDAAIPPILVQRDVEAPPPPAAEPTEKKWRPNYWWWLIGAVGAIAVIVEGGSFLRSRKRR
jgi:hypothetical protein